MSRGLSPEDHKYLNQLHIPIGELKVVLSEKRRQYAGDAVALWQIDLYDPESEPHRKTLEYRDAIMAQDASRVMKLEQWFKGRDPAYCEAHD